MRRVCDEMKRIQRKKRRGESVLCVLREGMGLSHYM